MHVSWSIDLFPKTALIMRECGKIWYRQQMGNIIQRMRFAYWITKAINIHSEDVILIAFPRQILFSVCPSVLRNTYIACLVNKPP
jgi:hypothetical protein